MNKPTISIVIRTLNEAEPLRKLLKSIRAQVGISQDMIQIIVVDNTSLDTTPAVAKEFGAEVINIPRKEFNYPKSMNLGVSAAKAPIVVLTVGHALPINLNWLTSLLPHFENPKVAGVYGSVLPNKNAGFFEKVMYTQGYIRARLRNPRIFRKIAVGVFGATNIALRRSIWEEHNFEEKYELGGEDTHWAEWAFSQGYIIIRETGFTVRHSHGLSLFRLIAQVQYWKKLSFATKFSTDALRHRKDIKW